MQLRRRSEREYPEGSVLCEWPKKVIAFRESFHGRTSGRWPSPIIQKIVSPFNSGHGSGVRSLRPSEYFPQTLPQHRRRYCWYPGCRQYPRVPDDEFLRAIEKLCAANGSFADPDEIQSSYGRTGKFFAHQYAGIKPAIIPTAKAWVTVSPIGGVFFDPIFIQTRGAACSALHSVVLYLAAAAGLAVPGGDGKRKSRMINAAHRGEQIIKTLHHFPMLRIHTAGAD